MTSLACVNRVNTPYRRKESRPLRRKHMSDETNESVAHEEIQEQAVAPADDSKQVQEQQDAAQRKARDDQAYNWAESRRKMQELERELRDLRADKEKVQPKAEPEEDLGFKDDDLIEGRHVKTLKKELNELKSYIRQREVSTVDDRVQMKYPDFRDVVSAENIEILKQNEPELAMSLQKLGDDPYAQSVAAYKMLKKLGYGAPEAPPVEKKKAEANVQKPVSVNAVTKQSAIGNAHLFENGLTKELKASLYQEMQQAIKRGY